MILIAILIFACSISAGTISGEINDALNGEAIVGVNVIVEGLEIGASTNIQGKYLIEGVPQGKHTLVISLFGYCRKSDQVTIDGGHKNVVRDYGLLPPYIPIVEPPEMQTYHDSFIIRDPIEINIENIYIKDFQVILNISILNRSDNDVFLPRILPCFDKYNILIFDENGNRAEPPMIDLSCDVGKLPLPTSSAIVKVSPHERLQFPDEVIGDRILNQFKDGNYFAQVEYDYKMYKSLGFAHVSCGETADDYVDEIETLTKLFRGRVFSKNFIPFKVK